MKADAYHEQEDLSDTIGLIYDSAKQPELWPELLARLDQLAIDHAGPSDDGAATSVVSGEKTYNDLLRPHFQRALDINQELYSLKLERDAISGVLERLPIGVILVDLNQHPVAMNQHARSFIESSHSLFVQRGKLIGHRPSDSMHW